MSDLERLRDDLDLLWVRDERGRLQRARTPEHRAAPALVVATPPDGVGRVWAVGADVPDAVAARVDALLAAATHGTSQESVPDERAQILEALGGHGGIEVGSAYVLDRAGPPAPVVPTLPDGVVLRTSADDDAASVRALVPVADRALAAPWVVALVAGEVAAVCESARLLPAAAAAGVWTYAPHRRRGLATAVVAHWTALVDGTPHYGHEVANVGSAGVARRVGFRPIGTWWWVRP